MRLSTMYGTRFAQHWHGIDPAEVKATWAAGLAGCSGEQIARGLEACMTLEWPPALPQFRALCCPRSDYHQLFLDACSGRYTGPLTYWAAQQFGYFELRNATWKSAERRWQRIVDELLQDEPLPPVPPHVGAPALPAPGQAGATEIGRRAIEQIRQMLAGDAVEG